MVGALESISTGLINLINTDLQTVDSGFKVRIGYPHESVQVPLSVYVNIIDGRYEEFGQGQKYQSNLIQKRIILARISVWTPRQYSTVSGIVPGITLYSDGTGTSCEHLYLDRICDRIQRLLITERDLNMNFVCDCRLRSISPLLFDEGLNAYSKSISAEVEFEEVV